MKKHLSGSIALNWFFTATFLSLLFWPAKPLLASGTFTVTTTNDAHSMGFSSQGSPGSTSATNTDGVHISLRSALEYASTTGGTNIINLPPGTYNLSLGGDLVAGVQANTTIYIHGQDSPGDTVIHQGQTGRLVFNINYNVAPNVVFSLDNVTVSGGNENSSDPDGYLGTDGYSGGAILAGGNQTAPGNVVNLTNAVFAGNQTVGNGDGGAIIMSGGGDLNAINCVFTNNQAGVSENGSGGAIYFNNGGNGGNVVITGTIFSNNIANGNGDNVQGGALYLNGVSGSLTLTGDTFTGNSCLSSNSTAVGGAIYLFTGTLTANYNRFFENQASSGASGVYVEGSIGSTGDLRNNWWGVNDGPNDTNSDTTFPADSSPTPLGDGQIAFNPWLQLQCAPGTNSVSAGNSTTFTASFLTNSDGIAISSSNLVALAGVAITFDNATNGTISGAQTNIQSSGTATATYTAGAEGIGSVDVIVDNATVTASITNIAGSGEEPIVTCPSDILTNAAAGVCLLPSISFAATATGSPAPAITYQLGSTTITSPATFPLGTNTVTCTATNSTGTNSCSFTVTVLPGAAPQLNVIHSGANVVVSWPTNYGCYTLQSAPALSSNGWSNYSGQLATNSGSFFATNSVSITNQFFRLTH